MPISIVHELHRLPKDNKKLLRASLYEPDGGPMLKQWVGRTPHEVMWQITDWGYLKDPAHSLYVGIELQKAYERIIDGTTYHQDPA